MRGQGSGAARISRCSGVKISEVAPSGTSGALLRQGRVADRLAVGTGRHPPG
jgi:hypothetical protein